MGSYRTAILLLILTWRAGESFANPKTIVVVLDESRSDIKADIDYGLRYYHTEVMAADGEQFAMKAVISNDNDSFGAVDRVCEQMQKGVSLIFDMSSPNVAPVIRSMAAYMGIPYVSAVDESYFSLVHCNRSMSVSVIPPATVMLKSIGDIVLHENLTNVAIIYDNSFDLQNVPRRILTDIPAEHMYLKKADNDEDLTKQIRKLRDLELANYFLISSDTNAAEFIGKANLNGLAEDKYNFFVLTKFSKLTCSTCLNKMHVVVINGNSKDSFDSMKRYVNFMQKWRSQFTRDIVHMDRAFIFDLTVMLAEVMNNITNFTEYNYTDCYTADGPPAGALQQTIEFVSKMNKASWIGVFGPFVSNGQVTKQQITLSLRRQVFSYGNTDSDDRIANWTERDGIHVHPGESITMKNIKKRYRVVAAPNAPPFIFKTMMENGTYTFDGYCVELLKKIAEIMDFEYNITESPDGLFGNMYENGTWNGVIRQLIDKKADIAIGPLSVMAERENVIDFTVPYYDLVGITILMKKPTIEYALFKFMTVLDWDVWGCSVAAFFVVSLLLFVFDRFSPYSYQNSKRTWEGEGPEPRVFTIKEGIWFCMMSLTPQGGGEAPRALSGRLLAATWWLFGFIMIAIYTANLAAFLTVSRLETPIETLDDLAKQFKTKYAPMEGSSSQVYFQRMADIENRFYSIWKEMSLNDSLNAVERAKLAVWDYPVSDKFTNMWESMQSSNFPKDNEEGIKRVLEKDFAYIVISRRGNMEPPSQKGDATTNKFATLNNCDLWEVGEEFSRKPYALAVQEGSPLKNQISNVILQLLNQRYLEELKSTWWDHQKKDCPEIEDESDGISINNIGGVFLVIVIGTGLGLLTLAVEFYLYKYRPNRQRNMPVSQPGDDIMKTNNSRNMTIMVPDPSKEEREMKGMTKNNNMSSGMMKRATYGETNRGFDEISERL